jgi:carbohydrate-selective porin OprB
MFTNFYGPTAIAALGAWAPAPSLVVIGGVLDPYTKADNFWDDAFDDVNLYLQTIHTYSVGGLPGQFSLAGNWSDQPQTDLRNPLGPPLDESWFAIANFSQYLYLIDEPGTVRDKLKSGQSLRGLGVFGRLGYAPEESNPIARHASLALYARGLFDARPIDSFGAGVYINGISDDLKADADQLGLGDVDDEVGLELFYDFAITPAVRFTSSYQRIWNPLLAQLESGNDHADVFYARLNVAW